MYRAQSDRSDGAAWEVRFDWTLTALMLGAYGLAIFMSGLDPTNRDEALLAAVVTGLYIVALQAIPRHTRERETVGEVLAVIGVVTTIAAVVLTDATNAGYILLVSVPIFFASAFIGMRVGMETALLATAGFIGALIVQDLSVLDAFSTIALYLLMGFAFSQARRLLVIERARGDALHAASQISSERIRRLESAHSLLVDLSEVASTSELSAISVAETALLDLSTSVPMTAGLIDDGDRDNPIAVLGEIDGVEEHHSYPIISGIRRLGTLYLWTDEAPALRGHTGQIEDTLASVALAFDNIRLLKTVARRSVQDERNRVARELHDDIGPALASLGLGLDVVVQTQPEPDKRLQLQNLRNSVTGLVEKVRAAVATLRREDTTTVTDRIHRLASELGATAPRIILEINERSPTDGTTASEVGAVLTEAIRNAAEHSAANEIKVEGYVSTEGGKLSVIDNGIGFEAEAQFPGHYGLVGMRERAAAIGGSLSIASIAQEGTTLTVQWSS